MWFDSHFTKWLPYHAIAILISGAAANFLLFSCVRNFFFPGALSLAGWATLNITNIVPRNWHLCHLERICGMLMACCSPDTTWVWNRIPTTSYCPNLPIILHILLDWIVVNQNKVWSWYMPRCFVHPFSFQLWSSCLSLELRAEITVKPLPFPLCPILLQVLTTLFAKPFFLYCLFASDRCVVFAIRVF